MKISNSFLMAMFISHPKISLKVFLLFLGVFGLSVFSICSEVTSSSGNIHFDINDDNIREMSLSEAGLIIGGSLSSSSNLHVEGNAIVSDALSIGGESNGSSNLNLVGTISMSVDVFTSNGNILGHGIALADSSSDNLSLSLPDPTSIGDGLIYQIKKSSEAHSVTIHGGGSKIDEQDMIYLTSGNMGTLKVMSSSGNWNILSISGNISLWNPLAISSNLHLWLDANDHSTITADANGNVSFWGDKSGQNDHATQGTSSLQPTMGVETIGGLNAMKAFGKQMDASGISWPNDNGDISIFVVFKVENSNSASSTIYFFDVNNQGFKRDKGGVEDRDGSVFADLVLGAVAPANLENIEFDMTATSNVRIRRNGTEKDQSEYPTSGNPTAFIKNSQSVRLGGSNSDINFGEFIVISDLREETREKIEGYLAHKWGLEEELPPAHLYREAPPLN